MEFMNIKHDEDLSCPVCGYLNSSEYLANKIRELKEK